MLNASPCSPFIAFLPVPRMEMRFCPECKNEQMFIADRECASGSIGRCEKCGDQRIMPFTHTTAGGVDAAA